jgi:hypothetical protein
MDKNKPVDYEKKLFNFTLVLAIGSIIFSVMCIVKALS